MKTTKQMARVITTIAEHAGVDLNDVGAHIRIENPPYIPLSIEVIGKNLVSVTHFYEQNGDLVHDPDMVFYTGYGVNNGWVPVHYQGNTGYYQVATDIEDGQVTQFYPHAQAEQASFANMWARNLQEQGFVQRVPAA